MKKEMKMKRMNQGDDVQGVEGFEGDAVEGDDVVDAVVEIGQNETE